jgi:diguanylate cyclase (GGDEF)-like protein
VDDFKKINDRYGHRTGDVVLKRLAQILASTGGKASISGRYGGEELCLIISEESYEAIVARAEKLRKKVENTRFNHGSSKFSVTISLGISSTFFKKYTSWKQLFDDADIALYAAKDNGKNQVKVFIPERLLSTAHRPND